jgi:ubiquinone/menaquinone biosynthesis C-methylase UbiE
MTQKISAIDEAYDSFPMWYDLRGLFILWITYRSSLRYQLKFFGHLKKNGLHLEVAIGSGSFFRIIYFLSSFKNELPSKIIAIDYAPTMLKGAQKIFKDNSLVELQVLDATRLNYAPNSFDSIHLANAIHCIPQYERALKNIYEVLKPSGIFRVNALLPPSGWLKKISERVNNWGIQKGILQAPIQENLLISQMQSIGFQIIESFKDGNCLYIIATKST